MKIVGIDYGSKMAGTTVMAIGRIGTMPEIIQSQKKQDADALIVDTLYGQEIKKVFLDAPLSLPGVYTALPGKSSFFYRDCDRELKAMSPMFLGGLTARAMRLAQLLKQEGIATVEVYPGHLAQLLGLKEKGYKKEKEALSPLLDHLQSIAPFPINSDQVSNWHAFDALLAFLSGLRHLTGESEEFGDPTEGLIVV